MNRFILLVLTVITVIFVTGCETESYTVTFATNGGTDVSAIDVEDGSSVSEPTQPTKEGFTFEGWFSDSSLNVPFDFSNTISGDITLHAKWEELPPVTFDVVFQDLDGTEYERVEVEEGTEIKETILNPSKEGYVFEGWYTENTFANTFDFDTIISQDMTIFAKFMESSEPQYCGEQEIKNPVFTIGFATDTGHVNDNGLNQNIWKGINEFLTEHTIDPSNACYKEAYSDADYLPILEAFTEDELDLIVAPNFLYEEALRIVANEYPDQHYVIMDMIVDLPNVASVVFAIEEQAFVAGVVAALQAQDAGADTLGFIGGMDFDLIQQFEAGFESGVWAVDPTMTVLVDYAGSFIDTAIGQALAAKQFDSGAYAIYNAAGSTSLGILQEARNRRINGDDVWFIGNDVDQYTDGLYTSTNSAVLTSSIRKFDVAVNDMATMAMNGSFGGGEFFVYGLEQGGVGLPADNPNLSALLLDALDSYIQDVINGTIEIADTPSRLID